MIRIWFAKQRPEYAIADTGAFRSCIGGTTLARLRRSPEFHSFLGVERKVAPYIAKGLLDTSTIVSEISIRVKILGSMDTPDLVKWIDCAILPAPCDMILIGYPDLLEWGFRPFPREI